MGKQTDSCYLSPQHTRVYLTQLNWSDCVHTPTSSLSLYTRSALLPPPLQSFWHQLDHENQAVESTSSAGKYPARCYISVQLVNVIVSLYSWTMPMWRMVREHAAEAGKGDDHCFRDNKQLLEIQSHLFRVANKSKSSARYLLLSKTDLVLGTGGSHESQPKPRSH